MIFRKFACVVATAAFAFGALSGVSQAAPEVGSPLVGAFCGKGAPIVGTGSSFVNNAMVGVFIPAYTAECGKGSITYTATGSGVGKSSILSRSVAWGGTDEPLGLDEWAMDAADGAAVAGRVSPIHQIPIAVGAVTVSYNLASCGIAGEALQLASPQISAMFTGAITKWNDPLLTATNANLASCNKAIKLAVRSDGSGTTFAFKDYLSKRNPQWNAYKNANLNTAWPAEDLGLNKPIRASGNGGVASAIKANDGAVGYVELSTAKKNSLTWAKVDGLNTQYNSPAAGRGANCQGAASAAVFPPSTLLPGWDSVTITDSPVPGTYAICTFTWALVYNDLGTAYGAAMSAAQQQTLVDFLGLAVSDAVQAKLNAAGYDALPTTAMQIARLGIATLATA